MSYIVHLIFYHLTFGYSSNKNIGKKVLFKNINLKHKIVLSVEINLHCQDLLRDKCIMNRYLKMIVNDLIKISYWQQQLQVRISRGPCIIGKPLYTCLTSRRRDFFDANTRQSIFFAQHLLYSQKCWKTKFLSHKKNPNVYKTTFCPIETF